MTEGHPAAEQPPSDAARRAALMLATLGFAARLTAPIHGRQEVCSGRCRAARSRQRKAKAVRERDAEIRALLEAARERLGEDR